MTKKTTKTIKAMGYKVYSLDTVNSYIKGGNLENQINIKKVGSGVFCIYGTGIETKAASEESIIEMLK